MNETRLSGQVLYPFRFCRLGATAGSSSSGRSTIGQAARGTRTLNADRLLAPLAATFLVATAGCGKPAPSVVDAGPLTVVVSAPLEREVRDHEDFTGLVDAVASVDLRARVSGYLAKIHFKDGATVKPNDLLFEIDPRQYQAVLDRAKADLGLYEARLKLAESDYERAERLLPQGAISQEDVDEIVARRAENQAAIASAKAAIEQAALDVGFTRITAPIGGRIGAASISEGNLVAADNTLLANIVSQDPVYVDFDIDERTLLRLSEMRRQGKIAAARDSTSQVMLGLANEEGFPHQGTVDFVDNRIEAGTGTIRVRAVVPNPVVADDLRMFAAGMFVRIRIPIGSPRKALLVSERALGTDQGQKFVFVVDEKNEVVYRPVRLGFLEEGLRVIEEGLGREDRVIVSGLQRVRPGASVNPMRGEMAESPQAAVPAENT